MKSFAAGAYVVMIGLFLIGVLTQFLLAGLSLFANGALWDVHIGVGYTVGFVLILNIIFGLFARMPRAAWGRLGLVFGLYIVQTILPGLRTTVPLIAALHPLNALLIFYVTLGTLRHARQFAPRPIGTRDSMPSSVSAGSSAA
jgi:mercuric ion transport protein